ncbi:MAG: SMP-30/gluconolactonase/LRE family protein [Acidobacteria bacterium]|nr:SMP-30/gluconolactonase/LRE family protein [Acidobacteriota bacterium]
MQPTLLLLTTLLQSPIAPGAKPVSLGQISAGEGPAWHPEQGLFFTGGGHIHRRDRQGAVTMFRSSPNGANGLLWDPQLRLNACEPRNRRVTRTEADGSITVLADRFEGGRFNSPNDIAMDRQGRVYFSDPRYGSRDGMELTTEGVYRIDAPGRVVRVLGPEVERANGVLVSLDGKFLYVADNNNNTQGGARKLWRFTLRTDGGVDTASKKLIFDWRDGRGPDGVKMDTQGRLYVAAGRNEAVPPYETTRFPGGVYILSAEGKLLDTVRIPVDEVTNCAFGGTDLKTLFITAGGTLWSIPVSSPGAVPYKR